MKDYKIAVIGLGYVGLPLAVEFARKYSVIGFDINPNRINELVNGKDATLEISSTDLKSVLKTSDDSSTGIFVTSNAENIAGTNVYIITVPTPVDQLNIPDLGPLLSSSQTVGRLLKKGDLVVYESTVYPGLTEEECIPVLQDVSGLRVNDDFYVGYSPERINPGDKEHTVTKVRKITSGSCAEAAKMVNSLYAGVITAGTYMAPSIKVAEAAKVTENAQRDINIAFVNELSKIFNHLDIDTTEVLAAAGTKWNFLPFRPGLVGGHCIGLAPYYLAQKSIKAGYHPDLILAGRRLNDGMGAYIADEVVKLMLKKGIPVIGSRALILGITFKENCPDVRNTRVVDIVEHLKKYHLVLDVHDPWADPAHVLGEYGIVNSDTMPVNTVYDAVVIAVAHHQFSYESIRKVCGNPCVVYDVKGILEKDQADGRL